MTTITLKINNKTKSGKVFLDFLFELAKVDKSIEFVDAGLSKSTLSAKDVAFLKSFRKASIEAKEISLGKKKGKTLQSLLDEF
ncbi:MAG: hypothetical protein CVT96_04400 [Bacteroidetes bacterium HGW-Bacteroidetes-13]|nr:MAG: hypothetical protein CVT96_04400 [Bacteroidetes bacterium HGW-Bacteroidetes-13]